MGGMCPIRMSLHQGTPPTESSCADISGIWQKVKIKTIKKKKVVVNSETVIHFVVCSLGADDSSDHELLIAKFRLKLKKTGETTRTFRYDLKHIP